MVSIIQANIFLNELIRFGGELLGNDTADEATHVIAVKNGVSN